MKVGREDFELRGTLQRAPHAQAVLAWLVRGAVIAAKNGLGDLPTVVRQATEEYRNESGPLADFLDEACVLHPDAKASLADEVIVAVRDLLKPHETDPRAAVDARLADLEGQIANVTNAVAMGGNLPALVVKLQQLEEARRRVSQQRDELPANLHRLFRIDWSAMERRAREKLASWRSLATRHVADGRKLLESLLEGPIVFTPFEESGARGYRFRGYAVLTGLIEGVADVVRLSSPKYGEIWRPHRDSTPCKRRLTGGSPPE